MSRTFIPSDAQSRRPDLVADEIDRGDELSRESSSTEGVACRARD